MGFRLLGIVGLALGLVFGFAGGAAAEDPVTKSNVTPDEKPPLNLETPTFGGMQFWTDQVVFHDWRIQSNAMTGHHRLLDGKNVRHAWGKFEDCWNALEKMKQTTPMPKTPSRVVLVLHGLVRSRESMEELCQYLKASGEFTVLNFSYASTRGKLSEHAAALAKVVENLEGVSEVNFVGHSLGNLVVRHYLGDLERGVHGDRPHPRLGRIVMLAPPNQGAEMARRFQNNTIFQTVWGASGQELATQWVVLEEHLAVPACEFGIIAGGKGNKTGRSPLVAGDDDFVVGVEETRLPGAADFLVLPVLHGTIMADDKVQECTLRFLEHGYFQSADTRQAISLNAP